jgi:hypothetical protein
MSRVHVHFIKEGEEGPRVTYRVDSSDFSSNQNEEPIARITINRQESSYSFEPLGELSKAKVVPPHVYDLPESECNRVLRVEYEGFGYGGWTARMANVVRRFIARDEFPDETYGAT